MVLHLVNEYFETLFNAVFTTQVVNSPMWQSFKYIWPLFVCQSLAFSSVTQMIFSVSIVGKQLASEQWATLPIALMPIGTALGVLPLTRSMAVFGRRRVMIFSLLLLVFANVLAAHGINMQSFFLLCLGSFILGISAAALSQLRFAAMEMVPQPLQAGAASMVLFGGIVAANLGPELGLASSEYFEQLFVGSYLVMAVLAFCAIPFLWPVQGKVVVAKKNSGRKVRELLAQPDFLLAVSAAAVAYAVMSFIMTATPISMHEHFGHSLADTKWVIQSHISAMFLPSLFSAWIIKKLGQKNMMLAGLLAFVLTLVIGFSDQGLWAFWIALVLLGIGWNFLFVSGTVLLPQTHKENERFTAQGFNDSVVFSVQAFVAVCSGILLSMMGWQWMLLMAGPLILWQAYLLFFKQESPW